MTVRTDETDHEVGGLLMPSEVMDRLRISRQTLGRYEKSGHLVAIRLPSGHRRYRSEHVEAIACGQSIEPAAATG